MKSLNNVCPCIEREGTETMTAPTTSLWLSHSQHQLPTSLRLFLLLLLFAAAQPTTGLYPTASFMADRSFKSMARWRNAFSMRVRLSHAMLVNTALRAPYGLCGNDKSGAVLGH